MDVYYQVKPRLQAPTLARKFDISHWLPCGAGVRSRDYQKWIDYQFFLGMGLRSRARGAPLYNVDNTPSTGY